ncbi:hypothetical protein ACLQ3C_10800 [Gordonia sp. DT30]|uniref:hypothetical protein n=1 Tax=unclassified Gordonia (in: high G+C Gram-positive bacteria) TaxID=2657482 RepID=UPI003CF75D58
MNGATSSFDTSASSEPGGVRRRRAPAVALTGVVALVIAGWGLADGPRVPDPATIGWLVVAVAVAIGALLIVTGARSART